MTHSEAQELLVDLAYRELPLARALEVEQHVEGCAECTREFAQLAGTRRMAAPLAEQEEPPPGFDDRILAAARAEASLRADGTPGAVIEVTGSVRPAGLEPAMVDPRAPVRTAARAARPRRALRWAALGSAAAAAVLALAVTSTRSKRAEPALESSAYEIHIRAPQQQPPEPAAAPAPTDGAAAPLEAAPSPASALPPGAAKAQQEAQSEQRGQQKTSRQEAARQLGGGGDISDRLAEAPAEKAAGAAEVKPDAPKGPGAPSRDVAPAPAPPVVIEGERAKKESESPALSHAQANQVAQANKTVQSRGAAQSGGPAEAAGESQPATAALSSDVDADAAGSLSALSGAAPKPGRAVASVSRLATARRAPSPVAAAVPGAPGPQGAASSETAATPSPDALEDAARKSRREANYALAAAQYRKAAQLRRGGPDLSTAAWDLAHAVECLSAISQWNEARGVRRELLQLYPAEQSAAAAAARALRPAELAPSSDDSVDLGK